MRALRRFGLVLVLGNLACGFPAICAEPAEVVRPDWLPATPPIKVYPPRALLEEKSGEATLRCSVSETFGLTACKLVSESPRGYGFGAAGLQLAQSFRMKPTTLDGALVSPGMKVTVNIPFRLQ